MIYKDIITHVPLTPKKAAVNKVKTGNLAEHDIYGVSIIVIFLSLSLVSVREDITAGTEQPKPINIGTKLRPDKPNLRKGLSIIKAILAI